MPCGSISIFNGRCEQPGKDPAKEQSGKNDKKSVEHHEQLQRLCIGLVRRIVMTSMGL